MFAKLLLWVWLLSLNRDKQYIIKQQTCEKFSLLNLRYKEIVKTRQYFGINFNLKFRKEYFFPNSTGNLFTFLKMATLFLGKIKTISFTLGHVLQTICKQKLNYQSYMYMYFYHATVCIDPVYHGIFIFTSSWRLQCVKVLKVRGHYMIMFHGSILPVLSQYQSHVCIITHSGPLQWCHYRMYDSW